MDDATFPLTKKQKYVLVAAFVVMVIPLVMLAVKWQDLPDVVPRHYGVTGEADAWGSKKFLLFLPLISIAVYILMAGLAIIKRFWKMPNFVNPLGNLSSAPSWVNEGNWQDYAELARDFLCYITLMCMVLFSYIEFCEVTERNLGVWCLAVDIILLIAPAAWYIVKLQNLKKAEREKQLKG